MDLDFLDDLLGSDEEDTFLDSDSDDDSDFEDPTVTNRWAVKYSQGPHLLNDILTTKLTKRYPKLSSSSTNKPPSDAVLESMPVPKYTAFHINNILNKLLPTAPTPITNNTAVNNSIDLESFNKILKEYQKERERTDKLIRSHLKDKESPYTLLTTKQPTTRKSAQKLSQNLLNHYWGEEIATSSIKLPSNFNFNSTHNHIQNLNEIFININHVITNINNKLNKHQLAIESLNIFKSSSYSAGFNTTKLNQKINKQITKHILPKSELVFYTTKLKEVIITLQYLNPFINLINQFQNTLAQINEVVNTQDLIQVNTSINKKKSLDVSNIQYSHNPLELQNSHPQATRTLSKSEIQEHPSGIQFNDPNSSSNPKKNYFQ